jgi:hypothetical protein
MAPAIARGLRVAAATFGVAVALAGAAHAADAPPNLEGVCVMLEDGCSEGIWMKALEEAAGAKKN